MERMVLTCSDFGVKTPCCAQCTEGSKTTVYPRSFEDRPDLGMGVYALMCCNHIHSAQNTPRNWWYEKYLRGSNRMFLESEIQRALNATRENHHRIDGEIHTAARIREQHKATKRVAVRQKSCPECGSNWNESVCNNCGYNV